MLFRSPARPIFFPRIDDCDCDRINSSPMLSIVSEMIMWESSQWLGKDIVPRTCTNELQESVEMCAGCCYITKIIRDGIDQLLL